MYKLIFASLCIPFVQATLYSLASDLPSLDYDFVIIGAGTAGNVIAKRLSEAPHTSVLVIEAGASNRGQFTSEVPFFSTTSQLWGPNPLNWNYTTVSQPGLNNRSLPYPRGFVLGGTSSINGMLYTRGSAEDYDRYAKVTGDDGWTWDSLQPYIRKNELWTEPLDHRNTTGEFNPAVHGFHGINSVSLFGYVAPAVDDRIMKTTQELPDDFHFNVDYNSGKPLGLSWSQSTIKDGVRSSSATSYLADKYLNQPNLHVLINARVTRILQTNNSKETLALRKVEFTQGGPTGRRICVNAKKEVIISAGSVNTPAILMRSGIGDSQELSKLGIPALHHLPSVGKNASDHPVTGVTWLVNNNHTADNVLQNMTLFNQELAFWNRTHQGIFGTNAYSHLAYVRLPSNSSIFEQFPDPTAGPNSPHLELAFVNSQSPPAATGHGFSIGFLLMNPLSRGSVTLASSDPFDAPLIDTGALTSGFDVFAMVHGLKTAIRFATAPVWKDYIIQITSPPANTTSDAEFEQFVRNTSITAFHLAGTSMMTAVTASYGVVNPDLKVKGISGLRIVDASVFPFIPSGHTQAPTYIMAERAADIIKSEWK